MRKGKPHTGIARLREFVTQADAGNIRDCIANIFSEDLSVKDLARLHDDLLFTLAYAPAKEIAQACITALGLLPELTPGHARKLQDSGISGTPVVSSFTFPLLRWICEKFPGRLSFHSFDEEEKDIGEEMKLVLPSAEAEILSNGWGKTKLFSRLCGGKITVEKMIRLFESADEKVRDLIFSRLGLYVELDLSGKTVSRTTARSVAYPLFYHSELLKKADAQKIISSALPQVQRLTAQQQEELVTHARMMLASLGRETDPVTTPAINETEFYVLERGFSIALFALDHPQRLAFDSYIGYMMYKNGLPVAYGGAWIFFQRALIGINIFDAYRGGESSFLFAQLLRVYRQRYGVHRFSVEPYQYGKNNPEGISSGAYWFYYRFGFRSDDEKLARLAEAEAEKIAAQRGYRTPAPILRQFTKSNITLKLTGNAHGADPAKLGLDISAHVAKYFFCDRKKAIKAGGKKLEEIFGAVPRPGSLQGKIVYENWCLALLVLEVKKKPSAGEKAAFVKMLNEKSSGKEAEYIRQLQKLFPVLG